MSESKNENLLQEFTSGSLTSGELVEALAPETPDTSELLVAFRPGYYSASEIAKAVEDCDIQLLGLSVTSMHFTDGRPLAILRIGARSTVAVERSLERYGYEMVWARSANMQLENMEAVNRAREILHYLDL